MDSNLFDLNGTDNDEMLRLYLRKAGLSDEIEYLTPEQRRAFIYDIIKSRKSPGFWAPSTLPKYAYDLPPASVRPPPRPYEIHSNTSSPYFDRKSSTSTMRSSISANSLLSLSTDSQNLSQRFLPTTPPSPSTFFSRAKGAKYDISGPMNFHHVAGDLTRDMTRGAFDLSTLTNDNVLKKYMIERGITDEDLAGMRKQDIVKKIVQSNYTWIPPKRRESKTKTKQLEIKYATISGRTATTRPSIMPEADTVSLSPLTPIKNFTTSNFVFVSSRFADVSEFPNPNELSNDKSFTQQNKRLSYVRKPKAPPPPPPQRTTTTMNSTMKTNDLYESTISKESENTYDTLTVHKPRPMTNNNHYIVPISSKYNQDEDYLIPEPPKNNQSIHQLYETYEIPLEDKMPVKKIEEKSVNSSLLPPPPQPPPPPPMPKLEKITNALIPPPPPPPQSAVPPLKTTMANDKPKNTKNNDGDDRDALLESIRKGINLKKVERKSATISGVKPRLPNKPPVKDFLTELKMGITLRRIKNPADNPFSGVEPNESNA